MSIIATVLGMVILLLRKITKDRLSPKANYIIWLVFLLALIFPIMIPSRISIYNFIDISDVKYVNNEKVNNMVKLRKEVDNDNKIETKVEDYIENINEIWKSYISIIIALIWFTIFITILIKKLFSYLALIGCAGNNELKDKRVMLILEKCKKRLKITRNIKIIEQDFVKVPSTIGIFNVKILVTEDLLELDDIAITDVFLHELSHYKRKDNIVNFIILIMKALYWFNPFMMIVFKNIRNDMEFATDEMAVSKMDLEELRGYCKVMINVAGMNNLKSEQMLLGLSNSAKIVERRINTILQKEKFEKNSKLILIATILIILLMCLVFYPSSYGMFRTPKLYLKLENGDRIEVIETKSNSNMNEIKLTPDSKVDLLVKDGKVNNYIFYTEVNLETMKETSYLSSGKISYFEHGEYIYKFVVTYGNNQSAKYAIKIIVE